VADIREAFQKGQGDFEEVTEVESSPPDFYVDTTGKDVGDEEQPEAARNFETEVLEGSSGQKRQTAEEVPGDLSGKFDTELDEGTRKRQAEEPGESSGSKEARVEEEKEACFDREAALSRNELRCLRRARMLQEHPKFEQIDHDVFDMVLDYLVSTENGRRPVHFYSVSVMTRIMQETTQALEKADGHGI
jgi:hypothetical protein